MKYISSFEKGAIAMPRSVRLVGWSTAIFSVVLILSEVFKGTTDPTEQFTLIFKMFPQTKGGTDILREMFHYNRIWSLYSIFYFLCVFIGSIQFIKFRAIGRMILEIACWAGILNACVDSCISYILLKQLQTSFSSVMGMMGMDLGILNPLGTATIILGFLFWIILTTGMLVYLRKPALKALMK
jgi:hypothetical protein